jgi:hypothetical protein
LVEIISEGKSLQISGGSYDKFCTWKDFSIIAQSRVHAQLLDSENEMLGLSLNSQCERVDFGKDPASVAIIILIRKQDGEELFIGAEGDGATPRIRKGVKSENWYLSMP